MGIKKLVEVIGGHLQDKRGFRSSYYNKGMELFFLKEVIPLEDIRFVYNIKVHVTTFVRNINY